MALRQPGASALFVSGQAREQYGNYWGQYTSVAGMPNGSGNILSAAQFTLEPGDTCQLVLSASTGIAFICVAAGTAGGGDAVWSMDYRSGVITPAALTAATTSDYNPTGLAESQLIRISCDADGRILSSLAGGINGRDIQLINVGAFALVLLEDDGATGTAANRFLMGGVSRTLNTGQSISFWYDSTSSRWRMRATTTAEEWLKFSGIATGVAVAQQLSYMGDSGAIRYTAAGATTQNALRISWQVQRACVISNLRGYTRASNFGVNAQVLAYKENVATALTATLVAGSANTDFNDLNQAHRVFFSAGQHIDIVCDVTNGGAGSAADLSVSVMAS